MPTRLFSVVVDALDHRAQARWWSTTLGWPVVYQSADEAVVGADPNDDRWPVPELVFGPVPEPKAVKNRIHLDLTSQSAADQADRVDQLLARGATRVDIGQGDVPWVVLADPEGNELCVLEPRDRYLDRGPLASIVVDAADPAATARFWVEASGWPLVEDTPFGSRLSHPDGTLPELEFVRSDDPRSVKNRLHLDVAPFADDPQEAEVERLVALGAAPIDVGQGPEVTWVVLRDPEGNEFCVLRSR